MTTPEAFSPLEQAYREFTSLILSLSEVQFLTPMDGWAPRDVVAPLIGWNSLMIEAARSILAGKPPAYYADASNDYSHINAGFTAEHASRSRTELLRELQTSLERLQAFIRSLPEGELKADHGVTHYSGGTATLGRLIRSLAGDYQFHTRQMADWFAGRI